MERPDIDALLRARGGHVFALTVSDNGMPRAIHVPVRRDGREFVVEVGTKTAANAAARPQVSLLCPATEAAGHSLVIDGTARVVRTDNRAELRVTPTRIVLHRSAPGHDPDAACGSDCLPLSLDIG